MTGFVAGAAMAAGLSLGPVGAPGIVGSASAYEEDPLLQEIAADSVMEDCKVSRARAMTILRVQDRGIEFDQRAAKRRGVVELYYHGCRPGLVVQVLPGTPRAPLRRLARRYRIERWVSFQRVRFTVRQITRAQRRISDRLEPLFGRCLLIVGRDTQNNGVGIELSRDATPDDVTLVRDAIKASKVPVKLTRLPGSLCVGYDTDDRRPDDEKPVEEPVPAPPT